MTGFTLRFQITWKTRIPEWATARLSLVPSRSLAEWRRTPYISSLLPISRRWWSESAGVCPLYKHYITQDFIHMIRHDKAEQKRLTHTCFWWYSMILSIRASWSGMYLLLSRCCLHWTSSKSPISARKTQLYKSDMQTQKKKKISISLNIYLSSIPRYR